MDIRAVGGVVVERRLFSRRLFGPSFGAVMFSRCAQRRKTARNIAIGRSWRIGVVPGGKILRRPVLYLGEVNDSQREGWCRVIEAFDEDRGQQRALALLPGIGRFPIMPPLTG